MLFEEERHSLRGKVALAVHAKSHTLPLDSQHRYGMNFASQDGLAVDGTDCDLETHWPWDPCTYLMPELGWKYRWVGVCMSAHVRVCICGCG
jgi:hypothetical protein